MKVCRSCGVCFDESEASCGCAGEGPHLVFPGPRLIDRKYRLDRLIGEGGMGSVYRSWHTGLGRPVAIKILLSDQNRSPEAVERFRREARTLAQIDHPNVVRVLDYGVDTEGRVLPYLGMELLEGRSLADRLRAEGPPPWEEGCEILRQVGEGLRTSHEAGILHRDLKPGNVFLTRANEPERESVKVVDFGLARFVDGPRLGSSRGGSGSFREGSPSAVGTDEETLELPPPLTEAGTVVGTPSYMAPESLGSGGYSKASDLYSFGALAYETLSGGRPFEGFGPRIALAHLETRPEPPSSRRPGLPEELDEPILRLLEKNPSDRPESASETIESLTEAGDRARLRLWRVRERRPRLALSLVVAVGALFAGWAGSQFQALRSLEDRWLDLAYLLESPRPPAADLVLVSLDDKSLEADSTPLPDRAPELARILEALIAEGAEGVAVDLLLPGEWGRDSAWGRAVASVADRLVLASLATQEGEVIGPSAVGGLATVALGPERVRRLFGVVNLARGADGRFRHARAGFRTTRGGFQPSFGLRIARLLDPATDPPAGNLRIDFTADHRAWPRISWSELEDRLATSPGFVRDRVVLLGAEFAGSGDAHLAVPHPRGLSAETSGLVLQGLIANTFLVGPPRSIGWPILVALAPALTGLAYALLMGANPWRVVAGAVVSIVLVFAASLALLAWGRWILPPVLLGLAIAATSVAALAIRRARSPRPVRSENV